MERDMRYIQQTETKKEKKEVKPQTKAGQKGYDYNNLANAKKNTYKRRI